jgi:hypothetical protein
VMAEMVDSISMPAARVAICSVSILIARVMVAPKR